MKINEYSEPAFPITHCGGERYIAGMTKRELIAMHLMASLYTSDAYNEETAARWAVSGAKALLEELAK